MQYAGGKVFQGRKWRGVMSGLGDRWVEPFCGGLGAYQQIASAYKSALISDYSPIVIMWEAVRDGWLPDTAPLVEENQQAYRDIAFGDNPTPQSVYALHAGSFRGMARGRWSKTDNTKAGVARLRKVALVLNLVPTTIRRCDYRETLAECGSGDVVYLDPPYTSMSQGVDRRSWIIPANVMEFDQNEMLCLAEQAVNRGAVVFVSHYGDLDLTKWAPVEVHSDQTAVTGKDGTIATHNNEYLYVGARTSQRPSFNKDADNKVLDTA